MSIQNERGGTSMAWKGALTNRIVSIGAFEEYLANLNESMYWEAVFSKWIDYENHEMKIQFNTSCDLQTCFAAPISRAP